MNLSIGEIFYEARKLEGDERTAFFRKHWTPTLGILIQHAYEPIYQYDLPEGAPPFKVNDLDDQESNLYSEVRRLYVFLKPHPKLTKHGGHVSAAKKEMLWVQLLENVTAKDSIVILAVKDGKLPYDFTVEEIKEIFPGLLSADAVETQPAPLTEPTPEPAALPAAKKPAVKRPRRKKKVVRKTAAKKTT